MTFEFHIQTDVCIATRAINRPILSRNQSINLLKVTALAPHSLRVIRLITLIDLRPREKRSPPVSYIRTPCTRRSRSVCIFPPSDIVFDSAFNFRTAWSNFNLVIVIRIMGFLRVPLSPLVAVSGD